jgi:predicted transposase/invertase (TIGR01784 family)
MSKSKINNPHDKFVKEMFADKQMSVAFLKAKLPDFFVKNLDFDTVTYENTSFLSKDLNQYFADIIFKFRLKPLDKDLFIAILIENKSLPDELIYFQLLDYLALAYRHQLKSTDKPTPIIPLVYYHGNKKWHIREILDFFPEYPEEVFQYLPTFKYEFIALRDMSDEAIGAIDNRMIYASLMMQRYRDDAGKLEQMLSHLFQSIENYTEWNFLHTLIVYSLSVTEIEEDKILEIAANTVQDFKEIIMSTYDKIYTKGEAKGIEKGIEKEKINTVLKSFDKGLSISLISNISDLTENEVIRILKEHGKVK